MNYLLQNLPRSCKIASVFQTGTRKADFTNMARPQKSELQKCIDEAESLLRAVEQLDSIGKVADISRYWATFYARKTLRFLRDTLSEREIDSRDFVIFREENGEAEYQLISDPEVKWKILHQVKENEDERKRPWLRAFRDGGVSGNERDNSR